MNKKFREEGPGTAFRYLVPVSVLALLSGVAWSALHFFGPGHLIINAVFSLVLLLILLGAAWLGYGPGLLTIALLTFVVPCHRVIGSSGKLVGYGGGLPLKKRLLDLECCPLPLFREQDASGD